MLGIAGFVLIGVFGDSVGDKVDYIDPGDVLQAQKIYRLTFLFTEDRNDDVGTDDLAMISRIDLEDRALQHPLKTVRRLGLVIALPVRDRRHGRLYKLH